MQNIQGHPRVFRRIVQAVNAGQVNQRQVFAANPVHTPGMLLYRDAWIICYLLPKPGQTIE
jgi:hypothetical protein